MDSQKVFLLLSNQPEQFSSFRSLLVDGGWQLLPILDTGPLANYTSKQNDSIYCLGIFNPIDYTFSSDDLSRIERFRLAGNSMIIAGGENGDKPIVTNLNDIVSKFGVSFNEDCIIRPNLYKHYHPKEAELVDFIVNRGFSDSLKKFWTVREPNESELVARDNIVGADIEPRLLYPYGCSLNILNKAPIIILTSSQWAIPSRQALVAFFQNLTRRDDNSRVIIIGSAQMMSNRYIGKEDNEAVIKTFIEYVVKKDFQINISDAKTIEIPEMIPGPDIGPLIDMPLSCLQEFEQSPSDKMSLITKRLFNLDCSKLPAVVRAYQDLNVIHEPLTLIKPELSCNQLNLEPATHGLLLRRSMVNFKHQQ